MSFKVKIRRLERGEFDTLRALLRNRRETGWRAFFSAKWPLKTRFGVNLG